MPLALITGASSGLGVVFARRLAQSGHDIALVARRRDRLEQVAAGLTRDFHVHVEIIPADLATDAGIETVVRYIDAAPQLDILVNNAGFGTKGLFFDADFNGQDQMHRLHVLAVLHLSHAALRKMLPRRSGGLINVSSVAAFSIGVGSVSYCATKAWMNAFTQGLAAELQVARSPVRVQALCPGFTITEFHDTMGMDRALVPGWLWLPAEYVVDTSLHALQSGPVIVIPGTQYKFFVNVLKLLPPPILRWMRHATGRRLKRGVPE